MRLNGYLFGDAYFPLGVSFDKAEKAVPYHFTAVISGVSWVAEYHGLDPEPPQ